MTADMVDKVRVAVRVRPLNKRERELASTVVVEMQGKQTILYSPTISTNRNAAAAEDSNHNPKLPPGKKWLFKNRTDIPGHRKAPLRSFAFDHCFMSMDPSDRNFSSQDHVFESVGRDLLDSAFSGYNGCIFAYGQTGSGKSFTMMGTRSDQGIIPRLCNTLFRNIAATVEERMDVSFKVEVSYMEIYNEKVHDLLGGGGGGKKNLRVREHKLLGPYVDGLSQLVVTSYDDIDNLMSEGNKSRTVAATNMNSESSRSHAVFNIIVTQTLTDLQTQVSGEKVSKLSLVDLAGSERAQKTGAVGERLREGSNINRSLTTLGLVISALADQGKFVPYRDSVLTWLLKDNLGGNSRTVMIATISPAGDNYEETLSTLRYADRAKRIVNHAVINEDPNAKIIRELREEVDRLRKDLESAMEKQAPELADKLEESEKLMKELTKTWEEKLEETERIHKARHDALEKMGISVEKAGIKVEHRKFFLVNLNADPSLNEMLVYYLKQDVTHVGSAESSDVQLNGLGIAAEHCVLEIVPPGDPVDADVVQAVFLQPLASARTLINGQNVTERTKLKHGDRILWGTHAFYRLSCPRPSSLRKSNQSMNDEQAMMTSTCTTEGELMPPGPNSLLVTSSSSTGLENMMGFDDAQAEVMQAELSWPCEPMTTDGVEYGDSAPADSQNQLQVALAKQKAMYEEQLELLKSQLILSPMQGGPQSTPLTPFSPWGSSTSGLSAGISAQNLHIQNKYREWAHEREQLLMQSLARLREQVARANTLVREANFMAEALGKKVEYSVTLQVPVENLTPNKKRAGLVSEPAVQVSRTNRTPQVWSMTKFENKIIDMREYYEEHLSHAEAAHDVMYRMPSGQLVSLDEDDEAFFDSQENHALIGVANLFLAALFNNVELSYYVPIINQQGEISGKLQMKLVKLEGHMPTPGVDRDSEALPGAPGPMTASTGPVPAGYQLGSTARVQVSITQAIGLPASLSHFVFCQYQMWGQAEPTMAGPAFQPDSVKRTAGNKVTVRYDHQAEFTIPITDDFLEHCAESALSVEVWGNPACGFRERRKRLEEGDEPEEEEEVDIAAVDENAQELARFSERWQELCRRLELWVCIEELNDNGVYEKVEVTPAFGNSNSSSTHSSPGSVPNSPTNKANLLSDDVGTGGIYQLKHGQSRRVTVAVRPKKGGGDLPLICESIQQICMGCVLQRFKSCQRGLDSYQESDLAMLRDCWSEAVRRRQDYLHERLQLLVDRPKKTRAEEEREKSLMGQWMRLTAERDAVLLPEPGTGIPGSPASWKPVEGMERHCPVIFLNLRPEDMTSLTDKLLMAGHNCLLPKEHSMQSSYIQLPLVKHYRSSVIGAVGQWDASLHDSLFMNRVTPTDERIYMVVKVVVRLTHPATMDLVLRKRICVNIYRKQSLRGYLSRQWNKYMANEVANNPLFCVYGLSELVLSSSADVLRFGVESLIPWHGAQLRWTGVTFQVVSSIPQASQEMEDRESLARLAATEDTENSSTTAPGSDGQTYIEKYIRSVSAVEGILQLDRLRQEVAVKEALAADKRRKQRNAANWEKYQRVEDYNNPATMRKYISVPNLQAMNRSSSMHSLVAMQTSAITPSSLSVFHPPTRTESVFNLSDQPAQRRASDVPGVTDRSVRKRPEPPKGLVVAAKNPLISPLSTGPKYGSFVGGLTSVNRPSMGPLEEEERLRKPQPLILTEENQWISNKNATEPENIEADSKFEPARGSADDERETMMEISEQAPASTLNDELADHSARIEVAPEEVFEPEACAENEEPKDDLSHDGRSEALQIQPEALTASVTQESLSETTAASSGYDSQAVSTTTLESEENLAHVAVIEASDMDTPKGESLADEALNVNGDGDEQHVSSDDLSSQHEDLKKEVSLNEEELRAMVGSRADLEPVLDPLPSWIQIGEPVKVDTNKGRQPGWIRFVGATQFAGGTWIGVELEQPEGKNDGSVQAVRYFKCRKKHGVFVRHDKIAAAKRRSSTAKSGRAGPAASAKARK